MSKVRTFIAVELAPFVKDRLLVFQEKLRGSGAKVKWVRKNNLHLTIKFLGDMDLEKANDISNEIIASVEDIEPFALSVRGAGSFPKGEGPPRVVWAGLDGDMARLEKIYESLNERLSRFGIPHEKRRFSPHITIGRVKSSSGSRELKKLLSENSDNLFGEIEVSELVFMMSELTSQGPVYSALARVPFEI